jgi:hypothetical protein
MHKMDHTPLLQPDMHAKMDGYLVFPNATNYFLKSVGVVMKLTTYIDPF